MSVGIAPLVCQSKQHMKKYFSKEIFLFVTHLVEKSIKWKKKESRKKLPREKRSPFSQRNKNDKLNREESFIIK